MTREIDEQTSVGEVYLRSLVRTQLRLALLVLSAVGVLLLGLPALFGWLPALSSTTVLGIRLPWLLLGVFAFPVLLAGGWIYVRQAERNERDFTELVDSAGPAGAARAARAAGSAEPGALPENSTTATAPPEQVPPRRARSSERSSDTTPHDSTPPRHDAPDMTPCETTPCDTAPPEDHRSADE